MSNFEYTLYEEANKAIRLRDVKTFQATVAKGFKEGHLRPHEFNLVTMWEALVPQGRRWRLGTDMTMRDLYEAGGAVTLGMFSVIADNIIRTLVMEGYNAEQEVWIGDQLVETVPSNLISEQIPDVGGFGDEMEVIEDGNYPRVGLRDSMIQMPDTKRRGVILEINREVLRFDQTSLVYAKASKLGKTGRLNKENRILDAVVGATNTFQRNGTASNTYVASGGNWVNVKTSNGLADWQNVQAAELLFSDMTHLISGDLLSIKPTAILVPTALKRTAQYIVAQTTKNREATDSASTQTYHDNPYAGELQVISSDRVKARSSSATTWWVGDFKSAFVYVENDAMVVENMKPGSDAEWSRDAVAGFKVHERGEVGVRSPQHVVKSTA